MELTNRQYNATVKTYRNLGGAIFWRVGTGKTRIALTFFAMIAKRMKVPSNFLVVCRREAFQDWYDEHVKLDMDICWEVLEHPDQLEGMFKRKKPKVWIMSHGKLASMRDDLRDVASVFHAVAYDEGFLFKNPDSLRTIAANKISKIVGAAIILSGSVMTASNLEDVYGQLYAVNRHQPIGRTLTEFRSKFMLELRIGGNSYAKFVAKRGSNKLIIQSVRSFCSFYFPSNNHRRVVSTVRVQAATNSQTKAFRKLKEDFYLELNGASVELKNTPSLIIKCQQISDGWLKMGDGTISSLSSSKMGYLVSQVDELLNAEEKIVIWCAFRHSVTLVLQALQNSFPSTGIYSLTGGTNFNRDGWKKNGRICVATEASGSSVNFLSNCAYAIYYSMDFHWLHLQQSRGRTNRHDSAHQACFYYYLQTKGSLDSHVYNVVNSSSKAEANLLQTAGVKQWLQT